MSKLLIEEPPLQVLPSLAIAIGLNEAIVLQQLHYLLRDPRFGRRVEEKQWIFNTYEEWQVSYFPFWSAVTIKRIFTSLSNLGLVVFCQPEGRTSRRKYYRIDTDVFETLLEQGKLIQSKGSHTERINLIPSSGSNCADEEGQDDPFLCTKTSAKTTTKKVGSIDFVPKSGDFEPKRKYPLSLEELVSTLELHNIEDDLDNTRSFFRKMTKAGWRIHGNPVFDWVATYAARMEATAIHTTSP